MGMTIDWPTATVVLVSPSHIRGEVGRAVVVAVAEAASVAVAVLDGGMVAEAVAVDVDMGDAVAVLDGIGDGVAVVVLDVVRVGEGVAEAVGVGVDVLEAVSVAEAVYDDVALGVEATGLREIWLIPLQPLQEAALAPPTVVDVDAVPPVPDSAMMVSAVASE